MIGDLLSSAAAVMDDIADSLATDGSGFPDSVVNGRTGATLPCLIEEDRRALNLPGLGGALEVKRWAIAFATAADVKAGDVLTSVDEGVFCALLERGPAGLDPLTKVYAHKQRRADGTMAILAPTDATFTSGTGTTMTKKALIVPVTEEEMQRGAGLYFRWRVIWDPLFKYGGTVVISANDGIEWTVDGVKHHGNLHLPQRNAAPWIHSMALIDMPEAGG